MKYVWIVFIALLCLIVVVIRTFFTHKKQNNKKASFLPIANTSPVRSLPEYKSARKKYNIFIITLILLFVAVFIMTSVLASRPINVSVSKPNYENRDIMLCLDVSGSMDKYIKELLDYFSKLVLEFKGQRVGLTVFNGYYSTLAPLTDDYKSLSDLFTELSDMPEYSNMYSALYFTGSTVPQSAIGRGVIGCVNSFDMLDEAERSRTIILATDNYAGDDSITLTQATNYAKRYDITIFGLSTSDDRTQSEIENGDGFELNVFKEFREATLSTGGSYYAFSSATKNSFIVSEIVQQILDQSAARFEGTETLVETDSPFILSIIVTIGISIIFIILWRLAL